MLHPADSPVPAGLEAHLAAMAAIGSTLAGHLTPREVRFLALVASVPMCDGDLLEIGSYKGKSTIILAKSAAFAGVGRVSAVDPLSFPSRTDPRDDNPAALPATFRANLHDHGVEELVDFHQMTSATLGPSWHRPLRLLWIDGDHTIAGARTDFDTFARFLQPGAIVAFHDVLHRFDGPVRVLSERVLSSDQFGVCGLVGSIGWSQYLGAAAAAATWAERKAELRKRLAAFEPYAAAPAPWSPLNELLFKYHRARVPHAEVPVSAWLRDVRQIR